MCTVKTNVKQENLHYLRLGMITSGPPAFLRSDEQSLLSISIYPVALHLSQHQYRINFVLRKIPPRYSTSFAEAKGDTGIMVLNKSSILAEKEYDTRILFNDQYPAASLHPAE